MSFDITLSSFLLSSSNIDSSYSSVVCMCMKRYRGIFIRTLGALQLELGSIFSTHHCNFDTTHFVECFFVFLSRHTVVHDAATCLHVDFVVFHHKSADRDGSVL